jgi:hypothetical protein
MALGSDPYAVLGVPRDASDDQIAQARRRLSREYLWAITLFPRGFDQVIPQVLALFLF